MARTQSPAALSRSYDDHGHSHSHSSHLQTETTPLLANADPSSSSLTYAGHSHSPEQANGHTHSHSPTTSKPSPSPSPSHGHAHSHGGHSHAGSMNMRALVLHVLGDALGNVGVIATGCIILLAPASWGGREVYFDPAISLVIAFIILGSAVPLGGWIFSSFFCGGSCPDGFKPKETWAWVKPEEGA